MYATRESPLAGGPAALSRRSLASCRFFHSMGNRGRIYSDDLTPRGGFRVSFSTRSLARILELCSLISEESENVRSEQHTVSTDWCILLGLMIYTYQCCSLTFHIFTSSRIHNRLPAVRNLAANTLFDNCLTRIVQYYRFQRAMYGSELFPSQSYFPR